MRWIAALVSLVAVVVGGRALAGEYRVGAGDVLQVQVYEEPDLGGQVEVASTCTVSLALVGAVEVCELTPPEIEAKVRAAYADGFLVSPTVSVRVLQHRSQRVDVLGEVQKRGPVYLERDTTLVEVISLAGGPLAENVVEVQVVSADGETRTYDLLELAADPDDVLVRPGDKILLQPGKVVYVEGQIRKPGAVTLRGGLTVTQALALAGGPDEFANLRRVLVRRADGSQVRVSVPRVHRGADADPELAAGDHVIVPRGAF